MKMRLGKTEDLDKIMKIIKETVKEMNENENFQWDETYPNREVFINDIKEGTLYTVVNEQDEVIGLGVANFESFEEYDTLKWNSEKTDYVIHRLAVDNSCRNEGVAGFLMEGIEKEIIKKGKSFMRTDTNSKNIKAQRFFEKTGYKFVGEIKVPRLRDSFFCYEKKLCD
jgi:ribosomal protein S18 acetylase RimI-like enzyme